MSSWLSGGLSSLTDQISTFTKEVIAESTQEIEDPVTELHLAKKRIEELEKQNAQYHTELKRCYERVKELEDRAETAELQVVSNNHEYKKLLEEKDKELKNLRKRYSEIQEQQKKLVFSSSGDLNAVPSTDKMASSSSKGSIVPFGSGDEGMFQVGGAEGGVVGEYEWLGESTDDLDYGEMSSEFQSHSQLSQLQSEVARLRVECQHWKELARSKTQGVNQSEFGDNEDQMIKELQLSLEEERRRHEHELTTLQALHARQMEAAMTHQKTEEESKDGLLTTAPQSRNEFLLAKLQKSHNLIEELGSFIHDVKQVFKSYQDAQATELESEKTLLMSYLEELQGSLVTDQKKMVDLQLHQESLETETEHLNNQVEMLQKELSNTETRIQPHLGEPNGNQRDESLSAAMVTNDGMRMEMAEKERLEEMIHKEQEKGKEIRDQLEKLKSDHEKELEDLLKQKESLENENSGLKRDIEQKDTDIFAKDTQHNKKLSHLTQENRKLKIDLQLKESANEDASRQLERLKLELDQARSELLAAKSSLNSDVKKHHDLSNALNSQVADQGHQIRKLTTELASVRQEKEALELTLEETAINNSTAHRMELLEQQLNTVNKELHVIKQERDTSAIELRNEREKNAALSETLALTNASMERKHNEIVVLQNELQKMKNKPQIEGNHEETKRLLERNQSLSLEQEKNSRELERLRNHLLQVEEQHTHEQLQADHRENQLRMRIKLLEENANNKEQSTMILKLQSELARVSAERDQLASQLIRLEENHSKDLTALRNLQAVLEDFQQGDSNMHETSMSLMKTRRELEQLRTQYEQLMEERAQTQAALNEMSLSNTSVANLEEQLQQSRNIFTKLSSELNAYKSALDRSRTKIEQMSSEEEVKVDKSLVRNLFVTYLASQDKKKAEIASLIGKILEIPQQELGQLTNRQSSWFSWSAPPPSPSIACKQNESFSKLFVQFLEAESHPTHHVKNPPPLITKTELTTKNHPPVPSHLLPATGNTRQLTPVTNDDEKLPINNTSAVVLDHLLKTPGKDQSDDQERKL